MKKYAFILILACWILPAGAYSAVVPAFPAVTAKGIAIYGWKKDGAMIPVYVKNEHYVYPIASLTKLITAKAVEELYEPETVFTISQAAASTEGILPGIVAGAQFSRDDLLKALLVSSSNDAATALMEPVGKQTFIEKMNSILHTNNYTTTLFSNPSGLDPAKKLGIKPNRMTPYKLTMLLNDIYNKDSLLRDIMAEDTAEITNLKTGTVVPLKQTNALYRDENYKDKVLMSKTGLTNLAGQNLAFVTPSNTDEYEYFTVVFLGSKSRNVDSKKILDWLDRTTTQFGG
jgi:D-alanyl-D-alanine carboxypeptidase (penicillin-binding protein 5/6)